MLFLDEHLEINKNTCKNYADICGTSDQLMLLKIYIIAVREKFEIWNIQNFAEVMPSSLCAGDQNHLEKISLGNAESNWILKRSLRELKFAILLTLIEERGFRLQQYNAVYSFLFLFRHYVDI